METETTILIYLLVIVGAIVLTFTVFRAITLWYWKVNDLVTNLEKIVNRLDLLREDLAKYNGVNTPQSGEQTNNNSKTLDKE